MADIDEDTDATGKKRQVASHLLLGADGKVTEDWNDAVGYRYVDDATGGTRDVPKVLDLPEKSLAWYAIFGIKTLWTNEASQVRQAAKKANIPAEGAAQLEAIDERHNLIIGKNGEPKFVDRTREAMVWEPATLIAAGVNVMAANGDVEDTPEARAKVTKLHTDNMATNPEQWTRHLRGTEGVENEYRRLKGGAVKKSSGDLLKTLGG